MTCVTRHFDLLILANGFHGELVPTTQPPNRQSSLGTTDFKAFRSDMRPEPIFGDRPVGAFSVLSGQAITTRKSTREVTIRL